ncbi:MAG: M20/M25/M40 family metallo-hydrolase [Gaiellales bacterium]
MSAPANSVGDPAGLAQTVRREAIDGLPLALADLEGWVSIDSPSDDRPALDALAAAMARRIESYGATVDLVRTDMGLYLHGTLEGAGRARVALLGHHDTVFPSGTAMERPFRIEGDLARGPGVADMKGGLAVAGQVVRLLGAHHRESYGHIELVSVPDEELREGPFRTLDRLGGFDAVLCMECGRPGNGVVTARKGGQWLSIAADGLAAHAGVAAGRGRSALLAACHEVLRAAELDGSRDGLSVNPTLLSAGEVLNSVPSHAAVRIDVRGWRADDLDWAVAEVGRFGYHPGIRLRLDPGVRMPPLERSAGVEVLFDAAAEIGHALGTPIVGVATGGVSDASWTAEMGIPTLDGLGPIGEDDHSPAERIVISSIAERVALVAGVIATVETAKGEPA